DAVRALYTDPGQLPKKVVIKLDTNAKGSRMLFGDDPAPDPIRQLLESRCGHPNFCTPMENQRFSQNPIRRTCLTSKKYGCPNFISSSLKSTAKLGNCASKSTT